MPIQTRRLERITFLALVTLLGLVIYFWDPVQRSYQRQHNTLGQARTHLPTADLFMYTVFALILYFGSKLWGWLAPHVFALPESSAAQWRQRLLWFRFVTTVTLLCLTALIISRA